MGTYGGEKWISLFAKMMKEDVYVVDGSVLDKLERGHLESNIEKKNPFFQVFSPDGRTVNTLTAKKLVEAAMNLKTMAMIEHNGGRGRAGHFAAYKRRGAPPDIIRKLNDRHHAKRKGDAGGKAPTMATLRQKRNKGN